MQALVSVEPVVEIRGWGMVETERTRVEQREPVVVLITFPTDGDVRAFASALVRDREAACVTVLPAAESVYRWKETVEQAREHQLIVKTTRDMVDRLRRRVADLHPYDTPEFLVLPVVGGEQRYLAWIRDAVGPPE